MPVLMPDFRTVRNDDFEEFYKETKNPIFVWFIVWHNIKMKKCIPEFALNYLEEVSRKILDSDKNCSEKNFYRFIFNQLGFRNRKDLQYIDNWSREERIFGLLDSYMKNNNVSQNAALDALKLTAQGSQDFNLIRKKKAFQKAKKRRRIIYKKSDSKIEKSLPVELLCAQKTFTASLLSPFYEPYGKRHHLCGECPERFSAGCQLTQSQRWDKLQEILKKQYC